MYLCVSKDLRATCVRSPSWCFAPPTPSLHSITPLRTNPPGRDCGLDLTAPSASLDPARLLKTPRDEARTRPRMVWKLEMDEEGVMIGPRSVMPKTHSIQAASPQSLSGPLTTLGAEDNRPKHLKSQIHSDLGVFEGSGTGPPILPPLPPRLTLTANSHEQPPPCHIFLVSIVAKCLNRDLYSTGLSTNVARGEEGQAH